MANGNTNFIIGHAQVHPTYIAGMVPGPVFNLRVTGCPYREDDDDMLSFAVTGKANPDGSLFNPIEISTQYSTGRIYNSLPRRYGDSYGSPQRNAIWYGSLQRQPEMPESQYTISGITNLMLFFGLERVESPISPLEEGMRDFDILPDCIVFIAKDPEVNGATNTACSCYFCPMLRWDIPDRKPPYEVWRYRGLGGAIMSPVLEKQHRSLAFLSRKNDGYGSDKNRIIYIGFLGSDDVHEVFQSGDGEGQWELSPSALSFASDGSLLIQVEEKGHGVLYQLELDVGPLPPTPAALKKVNALPFGSITDVTPVASNSSKLLVSSNSFVHSGTYTIVDTAIPSEIRPLFPGSPVAEFGLKETQVQEIWFKGAGEREVHAWVIKPSSFRADEKYPLAYLVHAGPHTAWNNQWSTWWNLALFAEQGYVVVASNPTGSTGYGQCFIDAIQGSWGGLPYMDLKCGFEYIKNHLRYVDTDRAVALGTSYGGYMINWIQGHDLGREFKALVTHDGIFSMTSQLASDKQYPLLHDLEGPPWMNPAEWKKWDPFQFIANWQTPHLIVHSELDYHYPISEGLAAFHTLQMRGVDSAFLTFSDENHQVQKPENLLLWYRTVFQWMNKHVMLPQ